MWDLVARLAVMGGIALRLTDALVRREMQGLSDKVVG
jgi:hypothetical protein